MPYILELEDGRSIWTVGQRLAFTCGLGSGNIKSFVNWCTHHITAESDRKIMNPKNNNFRTEEGICTRKLFFSFTFWGVFLHLFKWRSLELPRPKTTSPLFNGWTLVLIWAFWLQWDVSFFLTKHVLYLSSQILFSSISRYLFFLALQMCRDFFTWCTQLCYTSPPLICVPNCSLVKIFT